MRAMNSCHDKSGGRILDSVHIQTKDALISQESLQQFRMVIGKGKSFMSTGLAEIPTW